MDFGYIKNYVTNFNLVKANFMEVLKDCFVFDGKLNRTKFWTYIFGISILSSILSVIPFVKVIAPLVLLAMSFGPTMRRLIDAGRSKWLVLLGVPGILAAILGLGANILVNIPIIGPIIAILSGIATLLLSGVGAICGIILIVFCCFASKDNDTTTSTVTTETPAQQEQTNA